jgi:hypothetical protein
MHNEVSRVRGTVEVWSMGAKFHTDFKRVMVDNINGTLARSVKERRKACNHLISEELTMLKSHTRFPSSGESIKFT